VVTDQEPIALRPATGADEPFLFRVYASTRIDELAPLGWDEATTDAFLRMQFTAQNSSFRLSRQHASFAVVLIDGQPAGRLYVDRRPEAIHVIDVALLPEYRGCGVGSRLLEALLDEGRQSSRAVTINALRSSRALGLYRRLGFGVVRTDDVYVDLQWRDQPKPVS
jgi:ribosomal protein S18 acetylase RimI-like enzyme